MTQDALDPTGSYRRFKDGTDAMRRSRVEFEQLFGLLDQAEKLIDEADLDTLAAIRDDLAAFSGKITFVGQVKAGKTALVNALAGHPGLLPSDVNPWTSVVTTVRLNNKRPRNVRAEFSFFERDEWDKLIGQGGRLGEMARRAGADDELAEIRRQIDEMRDKSRDRLGRNFELLLGQRHKYDSFDSQLIERYVCLGDPDEDASSKQGRFADITRSADLYLDDPTYPLALSLQDTPGVNDPFLMREQITLRSMQDSSLCVVVLSAAQALNTVDLALVQLLSSMENRRIIIFVNRVDELDDPVSQIEEIRGYLKRSFAGHSLAGVENIQFGSAMWAEAAMTGKLDALPRDSRAALDKLMPGLSDALRADPERAAWALSGLPGLKQLIGEVIAETTAQDCVEKGRRDLNNLLQQSVARTIAATGAAGQPQVHLSAGEVQRKINALARAADQMLGRERDEIVAELDDRLETIGAQFIDKAVEAMVADALTTGAIGKTECDPMFLRMSVRTAYMRYVKSVRKLSDTIGERIAEDLRGVYVDMLGEDADDLEVEPPQTPRLPLPVALGRTIVIDLETSWWKVWLSARLKSGALAREYRKLVEAEVASVLEEVRDSANTSADAAVEDLKSFIESQGAAAVSIANGSRKIDDEMRPKVQARRVAQTQLLEQVHKPVAVPVRPRRLVPTPRPDNVLELRSAL